MKSEHKTDNEMILHVYYTTYKHIIINIETSCFHIKFMYHKTPKTLPLGGRMPLEIVDDIVSFKSLSTEMGRRTIISLDNPSQQSQLRFWGGGGW